MRRLISDWRFASGRRAVSIARLFSSPIAGCELTAVRVARAGDASVATLSVAIRGGTKHPGLVLDAFETPLVLRQFSSGEPVRALGRQRRSVLLLLERTDASPWDGTQLDLQMEWPADVPFLLLPEIAPVPVGRIARKAPSAFSVSAPDDQFAVFGAAGSAEWNGSLLQAVIGHRSQIIVGDRAGIGFSQSIAQHLSRARLEWAESVIDRCYRFLSEELGVRPAVRIVVVGPEDVVGPREYLAGAYLVLSPDALGDPTRGLDPFDALVAVQLAAIWWSIGVRVTGPASQQLTGALELASALRWVRAVGTAAAIAHVRDHLRRRVDDRWYTRSPVEWRHGQARRTMNRLALELDDVLEASPALRTALRRTLRESWLQEVPAASVLRVLRDHGANASV